MDKCCVILLALVVAVCATREKRFLLDTFFGGSSTASHLEKYNVDKTQISVSGVSSGAAFATQIHVIYSQTIMGIGMIAGVPYACTGGGGAVTGLTSCMNVPSTISTTYLETLTAGAALLGNIDRTSNMRNDKIWIFDGTADTKVNPGVGPVIKRYYEHYTNSSDIKTVFNISAAHGQVSNNEQQNTDHQYSVTFKTQPVYGSPRTLDPTHEMMLTIFLFSELGYTIRASNKLDPDHDQVNPDGVQILRAKPTNNYGGPCSKFSEDTAYLNNCGFSAAYDLLNFIYGGNLFKPAREANQTGELKEFSQGDAFYITTPSMYSMDDIGYLYMPRKCASKRLSCRLHVAFHGCKMGRSYINDTYVRHAGYNEVADLNDIIILYPQVTGSVTNPNGCWDWFGYTGVTFAIKSGFQPTAIKRMIDKITG